MRQMANVLRRICLASGRGTFLLHYPPLPAARLPASRPTLGRRLKVGQDVTAGRNILGAGSLKAGGNLRAGASVSSLEARSMPNSPATPQPRVIPAPAAQLPSTSQPLSQQHATQTTTTQQASPPLSPGSVKARSEDPARVKLHVGPIGTKATQRKRHGLRG